MTSVQDQPYHGGGGKRVSGKDGQRGDFLAASEADHHFTVLVEIKRPDSLLGEVELCRSKVHRLGEERIGGVAQLQSNCRIWEIEGTRADGNREPMRQMACHTVQPKGVLVIGCTSQLDDTAKRNKCFSSRLPNV
ncbi:Shedu anti-phage system protein SduA domain-containing protein [Singulisphaera sp. GP187]|uniref:Shedu anti-phage system protein SduA domain-containing protein n=1 Tax=Singulisphaera sp. GP187 TaxID=1882752 RepID=UPI0013564D74|nr:Shedu anti-phage system protein SduA domain-containing protein [Singulisphaera sp. GP187]